MEPIFFPNSFKPSPTFLPTIFIPFAAARAPSASILAITPIVMPTAVTTVARVKPCFLKSFFNRSRRGTFSRILSFSCTSWSFLSVCAVLLPRARSRTTGSSFSSSAIFVSSSMVLLSSLISSSFISIYSVQCGPRVF